MRAPSAIKIVPCLEDNYAFLIMHGSSAIAVDPGEAAPIRACLKSQRLALSHIIITHTHADHTGGMAELRSLGHPEIIMPEPGNRALEAGGLTMRVLDTPGHAFPHCSYYLPEPGWLFSGDCLFGAGCGRLAGDSAKVMWNSLQTLAMLPDNTQVFFGHEYTLSNLAFAASVEPGNPAIAMRRAEVTERLRTGGYSVPSTLEEEKRTNPFLRAESLEIRRRLNMERATGAEVFAALREAKNHFSG